MKISIGRRTMSTFGSVLGISLYSNCTELFCTSNSATEHAFVCCLLPYIPLPPCHDPGGLFPVEFLGCFSTSSRRFDSNKGGYYAFYDTILMICFVLLCILKLLVKP